MDGQLIRQEDKIVFKFGEEYAISFPSKIVEYNEILNFIVMQQDGVVRKYMNKYKKYGDIDTFCKKGFEDGVDAINEVVERLVDFLVKNGTYDIDSNIIYKRYSDDIFKRWNDTYDNILNTFLKILEKQESEEFARKLRKESRGRMVGGGFGFTGALKGVIQAETINMATGVAHSIFNGIGNASTSISANNDKRSLYDNEEVKKEIMASLNYAIYVLHLVACDILNIEVKPGTDVERASAILNNLKKGYGSVLDKQEKAIELLQLNPYNEDCYRITRTIFANKFDMELKEIANFFGIKSIEKEIIDENSIDGVFYTDKKLFGLVKAEIGRFDSIYKSYLLGYDKKLKEMKAEELYNKVVAYENLIQKIQVEFNHSTISEVKKAIDLRKNIIEKEYHEILRYLEEMPIKDRLSLYLELGGRYEEDITKLEKAIKILQSMPYITEDKKNAAIVELENKLLAYKQEYMKKNKRGFKTSLLIGCIKGIVAFNIFILATTVLTPFIGIPYAIIYVLRVSKKYSQYRDLARTGNTSTGLVKLISISLSWI